MSGLKVYFAGPDVFYRDAIERGVRYKDAAVKRGLTGLFPMDNDVDLSNKGASLHIYQGNMTMLAQADVVIANLNDFRGPDPDAGTVWEIGFAVARGKKVVGYLSSDATLVDRIHHKVRHEDSEWVDADNRKIENFGNKVNIMIEHSVECVVVGNVKDALDYVVERIPFLEEPCSNVINSE